MRDPRIRQVELALYDSRIPAIDSFELDPKFEELHEAHAGLADRRVGTQPCKLLRRMRPSLTTHYSTSGTSSHEFGCLQSPTAGVGVTSNQAFRYSHIRL